MSQAINVILAKPWAAIGALLAIGTILVVLGLGTPGAALIGLAGMLIMYVSGQATQAG
jgi:hypothetical protein